MQRYLCPGLAVLLAATAALICAPAQAQDTATGEAQREPEERAIEEHAAAFVEAFNRADAKAIAALFAEDGQMSVDGETIATGRDAITQTYADFFRDNPDRQIEVTIDSIRLLGPNLAIEKGSSTSNATDERVLDAYTMLHVRRDGRWQTATADVVQRIIEPEFDWKDELAFLVGDWRASAGDWRVQMSFKWMVGGNFLRRSFEVYQGDELASSGVQVIGWDPLEGAMTSWVFGSEGDQGRGWWSREGDNWVVELESTTASGEQLRATNIITALGKDEIRWQSTNRSIDGFALQDTPSVRVQRVSDTAP